MIVINNVNNKLAKDLIESLDGIKVHDNKIFCRGITDLFTPEKQSDEIIQKIPSLIIEEISPKSKIPGLVTEEKSRSQKKRDRKKKKSLEKVKDSNELEPPYFLKSQMSGHVHESCDTSDYVFSDFISETDDNLYESCTPNSESDSEVDDIQVF